MSASGRRHDRASAGFAIAAAVLGLSLTSAAAQSVAIPPAPRPQAEALPAGTGADIVRRQCLVCHGADLIVQQRLSPAGWTREIDKMVGWGAVVAAADREPMAAYLAAHFGAPEPPPRPAAAATESALVRTRCLTCHDGRLIEQQRLDEAGWRRVVDKMIGWGATVPADEIGALVDDLAGAPAR